MITTTKVFAWLLDAIIGCAVYTGYFILKMLLKLSSYESPGGDAQTESPVEMNARPRSELFRENDDGE